MSMIICLLIGASTFAASNDGCQALFGGWTAEHLGKLEDVILGVSKTGGMIGSDGTIIFTDEGHQSYGLSASCSGNSLLLKLPSAVDLTMSEVDANHVHVSGWVLTGVSRHTSVDGDLAKRD